MSPVEIYSPKVAKKRPNSISNRLELLAPAKNLEYGIEAIIHGADAVYIGGPAFGARSSADNSVEDIGKLVAFAHKYYAQVFVTLNTILFDHELETARKLVWELYEVGIDALIVQDMALLQLDLPPIALHASTQTDNRSPEKIAFLEQVGFSQVVLARELTVKQISDISANTNMQLEFFIHGALCVAYSGQCYASYAQNDRSANRGGCSQVCRLPGKLKTRQGKVLAENQHLLSLKDNNQTANLEALIDAGVRSFKIEGRLKGLSYVKNITAHYRQELDKILSKRPELRASSHGSCEHHFTPDPNKSFNRGSTDYFVHGRGADIEDFDSPKYLGEMVGVVTAIADSYFTVDSNEQFNNGDGLCYFVENYKQAFRSDDKLQGLRVNRADGKKLHVMTLPKSLKVGMTLYRNHNQAFETQLDKDSANRNIKVDMVLSETKTGFALQLNDHHGHQASVTAEVEKTAATDRAQASARLQKQLRKLGSTNFMLAKLSTHGCEHYFIPTSILNGLRRRGIEALELARLEDYQRPEPYPKDDSAIYPGNFLTYLGNVSNKKAKDFYLQHGVIEVQDAYELDRVTADAPLMITKHCLRYSFNLCPKEVEGIKAEPMVLEMGGENLKLVFDCLKCEMMVVGANKRR